MCRVTANKCKSWVSIITAVFKGRFSNAFPQQYIWFMYEQLYMPCLTVLFYSLLVQMEGYAILMNMWVHSDSRVLASFLSGREEKKMVAFYRGNLTPHLPLREPFHCGCFSIFFKNNLKKIIFSLHYLTSRRSVLWIFTQAANPVV